MPKKFFDIIPPQKINQRQKSAIMRKKHPKSRFKKNIAGIFCLFLIFVIAGIFLFLSKIKIEIWPEIEKVEFGEKKIIPARIFICEKNVSEEFSSSGSLLKEVKARGIVRIYNGYSAYPRTLVPSRFVSADGKLFWSIKTITIPGEKYEKGKLVPGYIDTEVEAVQAGEEYNIGPSTFALPALAGTPLYTAVYGKSFSAMNGGLKKEVAQVSQADLDRAKNILIEKLKTECRDSLKTELPADFVLLDETMSQEIVDYSSSQLAGAEADSFNFQVKIKSKTLGLRKADIDDLAKDLIKSNIAKENNFKEDSLETNYSLSLENVVDEAKAVTLDLRVKADIYPNINIEGIKKALSGKSLEEVKIALSDLDGVAKTKIKSWPFWINKFPDFPDKVEIVLKLD